MKPDPESLREDLPHVISLGAGVQSSCLALMCAAGEIKPMPIAAIFADVQAEPQSVYDFLDYLEKQLPFPVHRVTAGSLTQSSLQIKRNKTEGSKNYGKTYWDYKVPMFTVNQDGKHGMLQRQCTRHFKITPVLQRLKELCGIKRGEKKLSAVQYIGISSDEVTRMRESRVAWAANSYPLVDMGMSRRGCLDWMKRNGFPEPPRSACTYCPYHSTAEWGKLKKNDPAEFEKVVQYEKDAQAVAKKAECFGAEVFLHPSRMPIGEVDFGHDRDQYKFSFLDECEGMCGN